jgi:hydrogenase nickel incorporation protein HypA/HybF
VHELSLAEAIVAIARDHAGARRVVGVDVRVGHLRQVVPDALAFAFELVASGTSLDGAELRVEHVAARLACAGCDAVTEATGFPLRCASCGSADVDVVAGDELYVESIEVEDEPVAVGGR